MPATITVKWIGDGTTTVTNSASAAVRLERDQEVVLNLSAWNAYTSARKRQFVVVEQPIDDPADVTTEATTRGAADVALDARVDVLEYPLINIQAGDYVLVLADDGKIIEMTKGTAGTLTIPPNVDVAFPLKARVRVVLTGAGPIDLVPGAGVTLNSLGGNREMAGQFAVVNLYQSAANVWIASGDLVVGT